MSDCKVELLSREEGKAVFKILLPLSLGKLIEPHGSLYSLFQEQLIVCAIPEMLFRDINGWVVRNNGSEWYAHVDLSANTDTTELAAAIQHKLEYKIRRISQLSTGSWIEDLLANSLQGI